jgi:hypothetical protein
MKTMLIAAVLSLSLISSTFAEQPAERGNESPIITQEKSVKELAKDLAALIYLLESFGKEVEKELEKKRKSDE